MTEEIPEQKSNRKDNSSIDYNKQSLFKQFLFLWSGQQFSLLGSSIVQFVLIWWITLKTGSELILGLASFAGYGPFIILGPVAGVLADRLNRKWVIGISDTLIALITLAGIILFYTGNMSIGWFFVILTIRGIGDAFHYTTFNAILPTMVPQKHLSRMNGINFLTSGVIRIIGPGIGAWLLSIWEPADLLWSDIFTYGIAIIPLFLIKIPKVKAELKKGEKITLFSDFKDAIKSIDEIEGLMALLVLFMFLNFFFTPFNTLLPLFINKTHGGMEENYALVIIFAQIGTVLGGLVMSFFKGFDRKALSSVIVVLWIFFVTGFLFLVPTGTFWLIGLIFFLASVSIPLVNVSMISAFQTILPKEKLGRIMGVLGTIVSSIQPIAMMLAGVIGKFTGIKWIYLGSSALGFSVCSFLWLFSSAKRVDKTIIKRMNEIEENELSHTEDTM